MKKVKILYFNTDFDSDIIQAFNKKSIKLILFSNPSNPTGHIFSKSQMDSLIELALINNALIVSDEIYYEYDYDNRFIPFAGLYKKTLTLRGLSKSHSMTGLRIGYAFGPGELIRNMISFQSNTIICPSTVAQFGAIKALQIDISNNVDIYRVNRDYIVHKFRDFSFYFPYGSFFIFIKIGKGVDELIEYSNKKNILLAKGNLFCPNNLYVRISFCQSYEILVKAIEPIISFLNKRLSPTLI